MSKNKVLFLMALILFFNVSCTQKQSNKKEASYHVVVSILPQKYIVKQLLPQANVFVLIPPGSSPESYEPTPVQMIQMSKSDLFFSFNLFSFEKTWLKKIKNQGFSLKYIDLSKNLSLIKSGAFVDPHVWTSPLRMKEVANTMKKALISTYPKQAEEIEKNYKVLMHKMNQLHQTIKTQLAPHAQKAFLIYHPALGYYADTYDLRQIAIEKEGKEISVKDIKETIDLARKEKIKSIFVQQQFDKNIAATLAKELNIPVIIINPLSEDWDKALLDITQHLVQ